MYTVNYWKGFAREILTLYLGVCISVGILYILKTTLIVETKNDKLECPVNQPNPAGQILHVPAAVEVGDNEEVTSDKNSMNAFKTAEPVAGSIASVSVLKFLESLKFSKKSSKIQDIHNKSFNTEDSKDTTLKVDGQLYLSYSQIGTFLGSANTTLIQSNVATSLLQIFTSNIEKEIVDKFMNIYEDVGAYIKSPSLMWHNDELIMTFRIRLKNGHVASNGIKKDCWGYVCNYIYMRRYDRYLNPIGDGELTIINSPQGDGYYLSRNGPHDARLFHSNGQVYSLFATGYLNGWISGIWDYQKCTHFIPQFQKQLLRNGHTAAEKNWVPIVINNALYIIRHLDPMHVIRCNIHKSCEFIRNDTDALQYKMLDHQVPLRGGTSFELYKYPYYIGIGHSTIYNGTNRHYDSHVIVLCIEPVFRMVYVGDPIEINPAIYSYFEGEVIWTVVQGDFFFPTGLLIENEDSLVIGGHVNDRGSVLLRMESIKGIMDQVMSLDKENNQFQMKISPFEVQKYILKRMKELYPDWTKFQSNNGKYKLLNKFVSRTNVTNEGKQQKPFATK